MSCLPVNVTLILKSTGIKDSGIFIVLVNYKLIQR